MVIKRAKDPFRKLVERCQKHSLDIDIQNAAWSHALVLFEFLIKEAAENKEKDIRIVAGSLNNEFYNELFLKVEKYLEKVKDNQTKISIVILKNEDELTDLRNNKFARFVEKYDKGDICYLNDSSKPHFVLIGNSSYRFEVDHHHTKAIANFNDESIGKMLEIMYDQLCDKAVA